jgi:hypothetical protein
MKLAPSFTFSASTFRCSTTIFFTRSATSLIRLSLLIFHVVQQVMILQASARISSGAGQARLQGRAW